jgi:3',5'-cyclic AMP phosphodiesterase CpdA
MHTLIHLSDLHFGRVDQALVQPLTSVIGQIQPDLIAVSGDLTQRARPEQFQQAQAFLRTLPSPQIIVPGNHDVPLYNIYGRFVLGLARYRRYITQDLEPFYADAKVAVLGLNTARAFTFKGGRINAAQIARIQQRLYPLSADVLKIVVTHHPFDLPERYTDRALVGHARMAMERLSACGIDLLLAGHLHISHAGPTTLRFQTGKHAALIIQAGTATSTRGRGEVNAFNVIRSNHSDIAVERFTWNPDRQLFIASAIDSFRRTSTGWTPVPHEARKTERSSSTA